MNKFINRAVYPQLHASLFENYISVIIGPRQTGKTTLMKKMMTEIAATFGGEKTRKKSPPFRVDCGNFDFHGCY